MSECTVKQAMIRISGALKRSPIMVMSCGGGGRVDARFAATIESQRMIADGDPRIIGCYDGTMDQGQVREYLTSAAEG